MDGERNTHDGMDVGSEAKTAGAHGRTAVTGKKIADEHERVVGSLAVEAMRSDGSYKGEVGVRKRTRNNRICDPGWSIGGHRHHRDNGISPQASRTMGCDSQWYLQFVGVEDHLSESSSAGVLARRRRSLPGQGPFHESAYTSSSQRASEAGCADRAEISAGIKRQRMYRLKELIGGCCDSLLTEKGQSTVEFAVVFAALLCVVIGMGLLMNAISDGMFVQHAIAAASHNAGVFPGGASDVFCY